MPKLGRVAIIGCGYIGRALLSRLGGDSDCEGIVATTTSRERLGELEAAGAAAALVDVADVDGLRSVVGPCTAVAYLVAPHRGEVAGDAAGAYEKAYLRGVGHLLEACERTDVRRIVYTSSASVYGQDDGSWVDEDSPTEPRSETGRILLAAEKRLLEGARPLGIDATVLRLCGIWGPEKGPQRLIERLAGSQRDDGDAFLNLVHRDDISAALHALLKRAHHGVLNLNDDHPTRRRDFYDPLLVAAGLPAVRWSEPPGAARGKRVRNRRIKELLGVELEHPRHDVESPPSG